MNLAHITRFILVVASLAAAFSLGRLLSSPPPPATTETQPLPTSSRPSTSPRPTRNTTSSTAAARTLALLQQINACQSNEDFQALLTTIETQTDKAEKHRFLALLFSAWLDHDPLAALAQVRRVELLRHDASRVSQSFFHWAATNPSSAAKLLALTLDGRQSDPSAKPPFLDGVDPPDFLLSLVAGLGTTDPLLTANTLAATTPGPAQTSAVEVLFQDWYPEDPSAARTWAAAQKNPALRDLALHTAGTKAGQTDDPHPTITWAQNLPSPHDQQTALAALTSQWSQRHSRDAYTWTKSLPDGDLKFALMPTILPSLTLLDPGAAADWLNQYDPSPAMDASIAAYAKAIRHVNPSAAQGSATAITDPALRQHLLSFLERQLPQANPGTND